MADCPWASWKPATITFCENQLCAWIQTPANTWSNLAYVMVGIWVLTRVQRSKHLQGLLPIGIVAILVGIGSFWFHASGTFFGEVIDVGAMFLFANYVICFNLWRIASVDSRHLVWLYLILNGISIALLLTFNSLGIAIFTVLVTLAGGMEIRLWRKHHENIERWPLLALVGCFVVAFTAWTLDITGIVCDPDNHWLQGHAIWHVANSFCFAFLYRFYRQFFDSDHVR